MNIDFSHRQFAHCESGVTANLLNHHGFPCSEAMAFGIGSGLFFAYFPFIRLNHLPLTTFRSGPGTIFKKVTKRLGVEVAMQTFRDEELAERKMDKLLEQGYPVGTQTGVYWLPFFPPAYRFHFNGHNLVVFGKKEGEYLISDPVFEDTVRCPAADLRRARFAKGALAPKGKIYYIKKMPESINIEKAISAGIADVCRTMLKIPFPLIGVRGMHLLAGQLRNWPKKLGEKQAILHLGHLIRMQEEIGTGGAGFRFVYGAFLEEAAAVLGLYALKDISEQCTDIGDNWREFALTASRVCKGRITDGDAFAHLADLLNYCADREKQLFTELRAALKNHPAG